MGLRRAAWFELAWRPAIHGANITRIHWGKAASTLSLSCESLVEVELDSELVRINCRLESAHCPIAAYWCLVLSKNAPPGSQLGSGGHRGETCTMIRVNLYPDLTFIGGPRRSNAASQVLLFRALRCDRFSLSSLTRDKCRARGHRENSLAIGNGRSLPVIICPEIEGRVPALVPLWCFMETPTRIL